MHRSLYLVIVNVTLCLISVFLKESWAQQCPQECVTLIDNVYAFADELHKGQTHVTDELLKRIVKVEGMEHDSTNQYNFLINEIRQLEIALKKNVTDIHKKINQDTTSLWNDVMTQLNIVKDELKHEIDKVAASHGNNHPKTTKKPAHSDHSLTVRVEHLETRTTNLTRDNSMWRSNFRSVNQTFERMKKNRCMC